MQGVGGCRHVGVGSLYVPDPAQNGFVERSSLLCFETPEDRIHCRDGVVCGDNELQNGVLATGHADGIVPGRRANDSGKNIGQRIDDADRESAFITGYR